MNIIKNVTTINNEVKFTLNIDLFGNLMFNLLSNDYIFMDEKDTRICCTYIENMINIKHKEKKIEYRHWSDNNKNITKYEIVNYFTDDDLASYDDFFIDLEDITYNIISELYYDYIKYNLKKDI